MATPAHRLIQDQNLNILYNGGTTPVRNTNMAKPTTKRKRKALNDISNARSSISIGKEPVGAVKRKLPKILFDKGKTGGRKALSDLTNSLKQQSAAKHVAKMGRKLDTVAEMAPSSIMEEGFLHNHHECIKALNEAPDKDFFLKSVGLNKDIQLYLSATKTVQHVSNVKKHLEIKAMPELLFEDQAPRSMICEEYNPPVCQSPKPSSCMKWEDEKFYDLLTVIDSPLLLNL